MGSRRKIGSAPARKSYLQYMKKMTDCITTGSSKDFRNLFENTHKLICNESQEFVVSMQNDSGNILFQSNLIIFVCKNEQYQVLDYLFNTGDKMLIDIYKKIGMDLIHPSYVDSFKHSAIYYAIRSNNVKLVDLLIEKWPEFNLGKNINCFEKILSESYQDLRLRNVVISSEMTFCVESRLLGLRLALNGKRNPEVTPSEIIARVNWLVSKIRRTVDEDSDNQSHILLQNLKTIAKNIHVLKSLLRSTYDAIPWEEIEFCVLTYVRSRSSIDKLNILYYSYITKSALMRHLKNFAECLECEKTALLEKQNVKDLKDFPSVKREQAIDMITKKYPFFAKLYLDFERSRDVRSLSLMKEYMDASLKAETSERDDRLIIVRTLQLIGQCFRSSFENPMLSEGAKKILFAQMKTKTRETIIDIRNSLSSSFALSNTAEKDDDGIIKLFSDFLTNIKTLNEVVKQITDTHIFIQIKKYFKILEECDDLHTVEEITALFRSVESGLELRGIEMLRSLMSDLKGVAQQLSDRFGTFYFIDHTDCYLFKAERSNIFRSAVTVHDIVPIIEKNIANVGLELINNGNKLTRVQDEIKELHKGLLIHNESKLSQNLGFEVLNFLTTISKGLCKNEYFSVYRLVYDIISIICSLDDDLESIDELNARLRKYNKEAPFDRYEPYPLIENNESNINDSITKLIPEMKRILHVDSDSRNKNYQVYRKEERNIKYVLELLMVEALYFVCSIREHHRSDHTFVDARMPLPYGPNLLDYLLGKTEMADIYIHDPSITIAINARLIVLDLVAKGRKYQKYNQPFNDIDSLMEEERHFSNVVDFQQQLFQALSEGCASKTKYCVENGADILGRNCHNFTALHYAAKGCSSESLKNLLDQWKGKADAKNIEGVNPLHVAVYNGQVENVKLLLAQGKIPINAPDDFGRTSLHYSVSTESKKMTQTLLAFKADLHAMNEEGRTPLKVALYSKNIEASKIILNHEKFNHDDINIGDSPLQIAVKMGLSDLLPILIKLEEKSTRANRKNTTTSANRHPLPLHYAARYGKLECVKILLQNGWEVNAKTSDGDLPLFCGVLSNDENLVRFLVEKGADTKNYKSLLAAAEMGNSRIIGILLGAKALVNSVDPKLGSTALHVAAVHNRKDAVELLLKNGARVNAKDNDGRTALHICAQKGLYELSKILLKHGARSNISDKMDFFPHSYAAIEGHREIVELTVTSSANANTIDSWGLTALHRSCEEGHFGIVEYLLKQKANVNVTATRKMTPLHKAAQNGFPEIVELLLDEGASLNDTTTSGNTALHFASAFGRAQVMDILIQRGANINEANVNRCSPLYLACARGSLECVSLLIDKGCSINGKTENGSTPLEVSAAGNNREIVELLLKNNAEIIEVALSRAVSSGFVDVLELLLDYSPTCVKNPKLLMAAVANNQLEIIRILVKRGADVNAKCPTFGATPLNFAVHKGVANVIQLLLELKADPNAKCVTGEMSLHIAVRLGDFDTVLSLLKSKSKILTKNSEGRTPLDIAVENGYTEIVELLLTHDKSMNINNWVSTIHSSPLLHIAVGQLKVVKLLVEKGADINVKNGTGSKAIHVAARDGHADTVNFFLSKGMHLYESDMDGNNLLHYVAMGRGNRSKVTTLLLSNKQVDPNRVNNCGRTPLHLAVLTHGNLELVKMLLAHGAYFDKKDGFGVSVEEMSKTFGVKLILRSVQQLLTAAKRGELLQVRSYISQGAIVDVKNERNETPLLCATHKGNYEVVNELLSRGANPNLAGKSNSTPLHYASRSSHYAIVLALLGYGAVFEPLNEGGKTPLNYATDKNVSTILKLIDNTFLKIKLGDVEVLRSIVKARLGPKEIAALFNCKDRDGKTILACAILAKFPAVDCLQTLFHDNCDLEKVKKLLDSGNSREALSIAKYAKIQRQAIFRDDSLMNTPIDMVIILALRGERRCEDALDELKKLYETAKSMLGENEIMVMEIESLKAATLLGTGNVRLAVKLFETIHEKQKSILSPLHPQSIQTQKNYGKALVIYEKLESALEIVQHLAEKCQLIFRDSTVTLEVRCDMANILMQKGRLDDASKILEDVFEKQRKILGYKNEGTLLTMIRLGFVYILQKRFREALKLVVDATKIRSKDLKESFLASDDNAANIIFLLLKKGEVFGFTENEFMVEPEPGVAEFVKRMESNSQRVIFSDGHHTSASDFPEMPFNFFHPAVMRMHILRNLGLIGSGRRFQNEDAFFETAFEGLMKDFEDNETDSNVEDSMKDLEDIETESSDDGSTQRNRIDKTAAFQAIARGEVGVVKGMIDSGIDFNSTDDEGRAPLHYAVSSGNSHLVERLIENGAQVNVKSTKGNTPLHTAALSEREDIAAILLQRVEDSERRTFIDSRTIKTGMTALHIAASKGALEFVKILLKNGATYNITNNDGKTALDLSVNEKVTSLLRKLDGIFKTVSSTVDALEELSVDDRNEIRAPQNAEGKTLLQLIKTCYELINEPH